MRDLCAMGNSRADSWPRRGRWRLDSEGDQVKVRPDYGKDMAALRAVSGKVGIGSVETLRKLRCGRPRSTPARA